MAAAAEAGFVAAGEVDHPFFFVVEFGSELALVVADVDLVDVLSGHDRSAGVEGVGGDVGFGFVEPTFGLVDEGVLVG